MSLIAGAMLLVGVTSAAWASATPPAPGDWYSFAPYVDMSQWPPPAFSSFSSAAGVEDLSLAFVTAESGTACVPTWGGYSAYPAFGSNAYQLSEIDAFRQAGGAVVPSFGGQTGTELANTCGTKSALQTAYQDVISAYGVDHIDFDIEGTEASDFTAAKLRAAALAALQKAAAKKNQVLRVSLTLPVSTSGLTPDALTILQDTVDAGVSISMVNGLAMDYGDGAEPNPKGQMGTYAIDAGEGVYTQLHSIFPTEPAASLEQLIGLTPMIGINNTSDEIFTLANATQLDKWAVKTKIGMLSMWQLNRDKKCPKPVTTTQLACSGVSQAPWAFSKALNY